MSLAFVHDIKADCRGEFLKALNKAADERLLIEAAQKDPVRFTDLYEINFERVYAYVAKRFPARTTTS